MYLVDGHISSESLDDEINAVYVRGTCTHPGPWKSNFFAGQAWRAFELAVRCRCVFSLDSHVVQSHLYQ